MCLLRLLGYMVPHLLHVSFALTRFQAIFIIYIKYAFTPYFPPEAFNNIRNSPQFRPETIRINKETPKNPELIAILSE